MAFFGKIYIHVRDENLEGFATSLPDVTADQRQRFLEYKPTQKIEVSGDTYTLTNGPKVLTFKSGVTFDEQSQHIMSKTTITVEGNKVTQVQVFPSGITLTYTREFNGDELVLTLQNDKWDGVARRYYKAYN